MVIVKRAVKDIQKQERQQAIIEAALELFKQHDYQKITLDTVAERVGVARGTLYLYFKTREELFVVALEQLYLKWHETTVAALERLLAQTGNAPTIPQVSDLIINSLLTHRTLTRLSALLPAVLEQNVSFEAALRFKRTMGMQGVKTAALLEQALPFLVPGEGMLLLYRLQMLIIGLQPLAEPALVIRRVIAEPGMESFNINFEQEFSRLLRALLYGLEHEWQLNNQV